MFEDIRLRPDEEGIRVALYDLEADIMEVVWARDWESFAVRDVLEILEEDRDIAYTTVMTTVKRLFDKGILERHKDGRRYLYEPVLDRDEFHARMAVEVMKSLPDSGRQAAMSMLVDEMGDSETLDQLEQLVEAKKDEKNTDSDE